MLRTVLQGIRGQRKTAALMSLVLVISFTFMTLSSMVFSSVRDAQQQERERLYGHFQLLYYGNSSAAETLAEENPGSRISEIVGQTGKGQTVATITPELQEYANLEIVAGRLPENSGEILLVGPDIWGYQPGDTVKLSYTFHHVAPLQTDVAIDVEAELQEALIQYILKRDPGYKQNAKAYWNNEVANPKNNEWAREFLPEEMLKPYHQLTPKQQERALYFVLQYGPFFHIIDTLHINDVLRYPKDEMVVDGMRVYMDLAGKEVTATCPIYDDIWKKVINQEALLTDSRIDVTYTVCGIAQEYQDNWGTNGLNMPDAFIAPEGQADVQRALDKVEERYPYVLPQSASSLLLWKGGDDYSRFLESYNTLYSAGYRLLGDTTQVHSSRAYLQGIDPATGEEIAYNVVDDYVEIGDNRQYFVRGDLTDPDFRLEGLDPLPIEPVTEQQLYNNNTGILRINSLAHPPVGDSTATIELLLHGVLIGMSVSSCFQIYLQSLKRRRQKLDTLIAIGATDGQLVAMLLLEVAILLITSCLLGVGVGCLGGQLVVGSVMKIPVVWQIRSLVPTYGLMSGAVLIGVLLPIVKILREQLQKKNKKMRLHQMYSQRGSGYQSIRLRHNQVNRRQMALRNVIILLLCAILLLPVFLVHRSYDAYRRNVTYADRPEYELQLPYGAAIRYLNDITGEIEVPLEKISSYVTAENVYLHCDDLIAESPVLQAMASDTRGSALFRKLKGGETGFSIRMITGSWDSALVQSVIASTGKPINQEDFEKGKSCVLLVPRYREQGGTPVLSDISADVLENTSEDLQMAYLLDSSLQKVYAGSYGEDNVLLSLDTVRISGYSQKLTDTVLIETVNTVEVDVAATVCQLNEPLWPLSNEAGITVLCSVNMLDEVYPNALTRMSGQDSRYFRAASELFYPDCYGKSYVQLWPDSTQMQTAAIERSLEALCEEHDFDLVRYHLNNQNLKESAQNSSSLQLVFCINMVLITGLLLFNLLREEAEEDRRRLGILQVLGMTDRQYLLGQSAQMVKTGGLSILLAHVILLIALCMGFLIQGGGASNMLLQLKLSMQDFPVWWDLGLSALYLLSLQIMELYAVLPILRRSPAEKIRG